MTAQTLIITPEYRNEAEEIMDILGDYGYYPVRFGSIIIFAEQQHPFSIKTITKIINSKGYAYEVTTTETTPEELLLYAAKRANQ